jgi:carbonic anhydrase
MKWTLSSVRISAVFGAAVILTGCATSKTGSCPCAESCHHSAAKAGVPLGQAAQQALTPEQALDRLKQGNQRFVAGTPLHRDLAAERQATATGQYPFAVVLSCLDSRTSSELIFDQGLGDLFNARVAGNVLNEDIVGSMEFACQAAGAKLIAVVGHSKCGAVKGACAGVELGNLTGLLQKMQPAVAAVPASGNKTDDAYVDAVAKENVKLVMRQIKERSPILSQLISSGKVMLVGGMYDLETGQVAFLQ